MTARKFCTTALCLCLMAIFGGQRLSAADSEQRQWNQLKAKMRAEGWSQIADGVFERQMGPTKVERIGYGRPGIAWTINDLNSRLRTLNERYQDDPSEDLANAIDELSGLVARTRQDFQVMPQGLTSASAAVTGGSCSSICYSATADAYPLTTPQGVGAVAQAKFNSTCGYSGETYAWAEASATLSGTANHVIQYSNPPATGTSIVSDATAITYGTSGCSSNANAYALSTALGISYSTSDTNSSCPAPPSLPPVPTINGSSYEGFWLLNCRTVTWTSTVTSGVSPYTYQWKFNGAAVGTGSSYSRSVCYNTADFTLSLTVTGANSLTGTASLFVDVEYSPPDPGPGCVVQGQQLQPCQ